jgi:hypothetical protein
MAVETETETEEGTTRTAPGRVQVLVALTFGAVLTLVGLVAPALGGVESELFGLFGRNYLHDAIHVVTGVFGLVAGFVAGGTAAVEYNRYLGAVYLLVFVLGAAALLAGLTGLTGLINLNWADNALHLLLGVVLAGVGFGLGNR